MTGRNVPRDGTAAGRMPIGSFPTALELAPSLSAPGFELWVKRDDRTNALYGGNKVRKLERVLAEVLARGATRIVTVGAACVTAVPVRKALSA